MNLPLAHKIIAEAEAQPFGFLKVRGRELTHEVRLMAKAGLIKESESNGAPDLDEAVITRVTHAGHQFYRALKQVRAYSHN